MNKEEFLSELRECLHGEVEESVILDSISYYRGYIEEQIGHGKTEQQVLEELGDANFIARSIIDANEREFEYNEEEVIQEGYQDPYREMERQEKRENIQQTTSNVLHGVVIIAIILFILVIVGVLFRALLPLIFILIAVGIIKKLFEQHS